MPNTITPSPTPSIPGEDHDIECSICYTPIVWGSRNVVVTPCNHYFHDECITNWFSACLERKRISTCGSCNSQVKSFQPVGEKREDEINPYCVYEDPLLSVCRENNLPQLKKALSEDPGIARQYFRSAFVGYDVTLLHVVASRGHGEMARLLIEAKADLNAADKNRLPPISYAARIGSDKVVKLLIEAKADPNAADTNGFPPISYAAQFGHKKVVKLLIEAKADLNAASKNGSTPIIIASYLGYVEIVNLLINAQADLNAVCKYGLPPISYAAQYGHKKVVKLLIEAKADLNIACKSWKTALVVAARNGHLLIVYWLLESGAEPEQAGTTRYPSIPWYKVIFNLLSARTALQAALENDHYFVAARINNHIREKNMALRYQSQSNNAFQYNANNLD